MSGKEFDAAYSKLAKDYLATNENRLVQSSLVNPGPIQRSDAWLLLAIYYAVKIENEFKLETIIAWGDYINHAVFTNAELAGGFGRLERSGFIACHGATCELTPAFLKAWKTAKTDDHQTVFQQLDDVKKLLGAPDC